MSKLNFSFICDYASFSENGKLNLLGIFKSITGTTLPITHPQLFIVTNILVEEIGSYKEVVKLVRVDDGQDVIKPMEFDFSANKLDDQGIEFGVIGQINNIVFEKSGKYVFKIFLNQDLMGEIPLEVNIIK